MRELRLKYIIQMVSDIAGKAKTDERALTLAQKAVQDALKKTVDEAGLLERVLLRVARVGSRSAAEQADYIARLAMRYQDLRKHAEGAAQAMTKAAAVGAGALAGGYAVDRVTRAPMEYSLRLAHMANTAYADRDAAGRIAGKRTLNAAIEAAVRTGGGTRDDAAGALDTLIASGAVTADQAVRLLPMLMRGHTASGATPEQLAGIALRGMQSFGIQLDQVPEVLNMAMAAGQAGGFELRDMAKWLPQAMAAGRLSGLSGMEGMRRILASLQAQVIVAGSKDEAGNNLINLLAKINSQDTAKDAKKLGIDLPQYLAGQREKGVNSLDAFVAMVDGVAAKDPAYAALKKKLEGAPEGERGATLQSMADILQGSSIGTIIQDRQALMALVAEMNNRKYVQSVMDTTRTNTGALGTSFDVISQETAFARQRAINEAAIGSQKAFEAAAPALDAVANKAADAAGQFPRLTAAVMGATGVITVFAAALGASGLVGILTGRAGNAGGIIGTAGTVAAGAAASGISSLWRANGWAVRAGGAFIGPLIGAGMDAYSAYADPTLSDAARKRAYAAAGAGAVGGWGGAALGAGIGSMLLPGVGTLIGAGVGGLGGYLAGRSGLEWLWGQDPAGAAVGPDGAPSIAAPRLEIGKGQVDLNVRVQDDRITWQMAAQSPPGLSLSPGNTNPGGYGSTTP